MKFKKYPSVDCPDRKQLKDYDDGWMLAECMNTTSPHAISCEYNRHPNVKLCPRGFVLNTEQNIINDICAHPKLARKFRHSLSRKSR